MKIALYLIRKEVDDVPKIYATLIIKGKKTFEQTPASIQLATAQCLIDVDCAFLVPAEYLAAHADELTGLE